MMIIGISGLAGAGKSTVARRLCAEWGARYHPFAAPLKRMLRQFLEDQGVCLVDASRMMNGDLKETPVDCLDGQTPRRAMQLLGTEWGRGLSMDLWVNAWRRAAEMARLEASADSTAALLVADDVRFPNEVAAIRAIGGIVVRVDRPGVGLAGGAGAHVSEMLDLGPPDQVIVNDGYLAKLHGRVDRLVEEFVRAAPGP